MALAPPPSFSLSDFLSGISHTIETIHGNPTWIRAEIVSASPRAKGYWVLEIQDTNDKGQKIANASVMVWYRQVASVIHYFKRATGQDLGPGMRVLLQVEAAFTPDWGFRLTAHAIDPSWTLGQAQQELDRVREDLQKEGIWNLNKQLANPKDFTKVAVIAPDSSAGLGDFWKEAHVLEQFRLCQFEVLSAAFEGVNAVRDIPALLSLLNEQSQEFDAVFIVRGGGATTGLNTLNQEAIVRSVCQCKMPIFIGIGHEKDSTLLDEVAHTVLGTPSKAVGYLVHVIVQNGRTALLNWLEISQGISLRLKEAKQQIDRLLEDVNHGRQVILEKAKKDIDVLLRESMGLGPQATLDRGYTLIENEGKIVHSTEEAKLIKGKKIQIRFKDGVISGTL